MAQLFSPSSNTVAPSVLAGAVVLVGLLGVADYLVVWSPYSTWVGVPVSQPVPFSHEHHVSGLGIDCRYCHTGVETAAFAGLPATHTCMTCHSQLWTEAKVLAPVRESLVNNQPIQWNRVNALPDYVYFNHSIHIAKGVGCVSCHGRIDQMPITAKGQTLYMKFCLECHRQPERFLRDPSEVFNMASQNPTEAVGKQRMEAQHIQRETLVDCSTCHR